MNGYVISVQTSECYAASPNFIGHSSNKLDELYVTTRLINPESSHAPEAVGGDGMMACLMS